MRRNFHQQPDPDRRRPSENRQDAFGQRRTGAAECDARSEFRSSSRHQSPSEPLLEYSPAPRSRAEQSGRRYQAGRDCLRPAEDHSTPASISSAGSDAMGDAQRMPPRRGDPEAAALPDRDRAPLARCDAGAGRPRKLQMLYFMHQARRDLSSDAAWPREPARDLRATLARAAQPIASSSGSSPGKRKRCWLRGLDCLDGTPSSTKAPGLTAGRLAACRFKTDQPSTYC